jgi:hypothetical protein
MSRAQWAGALVAAMLSGSPADAAGIDSRAYTCADLHALIQAQGFVFISQPAFGDFVVANPSFCGGGEAVQPLSVPTADRPECPVNYCASRRNNS